MNMLLNKMEVDLHARSFNSIRGHKSSVVEEANEHYSTSKDGWCKFSYTFTCEV